MAKTLYDKIWDAHLVHEQQGEASVLYIDRHLVHEVTSPQAFEGLRNAGRKVRRPDLTLAVADHNVPTTNRAAASPIRNPRSRSQTLEAIRASSASNISRWTISARASCNRGAGAGLDAAGHDHRLRRLPHLDAWRVRRARLRHRHQRRRAHARDADAADRQVEEHARDGGRRAARSASPRKTWRSPSSRASARRAARAMSSNMRATRSQSFPWKAA